MIPYGKQTIEKDDIQSVVDVLKSDYLTTGPKIAEFEKMVADYVGAKYAVLKLIILIRKISAEKSQTKQRQLLQFIWQDSLAIWTRFIK